MIDLRKFVDSLGPLSISKDNAAVALAAFRCEAILTERARCAGIVEAIDSGRGNEKAIARAIRNPNHV